MRYADIRKLALECGIKDNRVSVGMWANINGYIKKCSKDKDRHNYYYYIKIDTL